MFQFHLLQVGSAVYYVLFDGPRYRIRKTRQSLKLYERYLESA